MPRAWPLGLPLLLEDAPDRLGNLVARSLDAEAVAEFGARTVWELVKGGTALARAIPHNDDRVTLKRRVSGLLKAAA